MDSLPRAANGTGGGSGWRSGRIRRRTRAPVVLVLRDSSDWRKNLARPVNKPDRDGLARRARVHFKRACSCSLHACHLRAASLNLVGIGDIRTRHDWGWTLLMRNVAKPPAPPDIELQWPIQWTMTLLWAAWIFRTGRAVARCAPSREIASCLAVALTGWIAILRSRNRIRSGKGRGPTFSCLSRSCSDGTGARSCAFRRRDPNSPCKGAHGTARVEIPHAWDDGV